MLDILKLVKLVWGVNWKSSGKSVPSLKGEQSFVSYDTRPKNTNLLPSRDSLGMSKVFATSQNNAISTNNVWEAQISWPAARWLHGKLNEANWSRQEHLLNKTAIVRKHKVFGVVDLWVIDAGEKHRLFSARFECFPRLCLGCWRFP